MLTDLTIDLGYMKKLNILKSKEDELRLIEEYHNKVDAAYQETFESTILNAYCLDDQTLKFARNIKDFCDNHAKQTISIQNALHTLPQEIDGLKKELGIVEDTTDCFIPCNERAIPCNERDKSCKNTTTASAQSNRYEKFTDCKTSNVTEASELEQMTDDIACMEEFLKECHESCNKGERRLWKEDKTVRMLDSLMQELDGLNDVLVDRMSSEPEQMLFKRIEDVRKGAWEAIKSLHKEALRYDPFISPRVK